MSYRTKTIKGELVSEPILKLQELGYLVNLTECERQIGIKPQSFRVCFEFGRCTHVFKHISEIESFLKFNLFYISGSITQYLNLLGRILNLTELSRILNTKSSSLKSCIEQNRCKETPFNELELIIKQKFTL